MTLGAFDPVYKKPQIPAFHHYYRDLKSADTVSKVFLVLVDYFSFINYHVIEHVITVCGTKEDKENLLRYEEKFDEYAKRRIFECHPCFGPESETDHTNVFKPHHLQRGRVSSCNHQVIAEERNYQHIG